MAEKRGMKALELWCRRVTEGYPGVKIENMTTSWRDGLAFCALIHHFRPDLIDFDRLDKRDIYKNNELAFRTAERQLGIPALLDAEDMVEYEVPDRLSILTYLSQFYQAFVSNQQGSTTPSSRTHSSKVAEIISPNTKTSKTPKVGSGRLETCWSCRRPVFLAERLVAGGKLRHRTCFTCKRCGHQLSLVDCYETETGDFVCETCPDEEKRGEIHPDSETSACEGDTTDVDFLRDEYSFNFETALDSMTEISSVETKKFLHDLIEDTSDVRRSAMKNSVSIGKFEIADPPLTGRNFDENSSERFLSDINQHSTANLESLYCKIKSLLSGDLTETLSLLNHEPESFLGDVSDIIDNIISDAVKEAENRVKGLSSDAKPLPEIVIQVKPDEVSDSISPEKKLDRVSVFTNRADEHEKKIEQPKTEEPTKDVRPTVDSRESDYPDELNPFADDDEIQIAKPPITPRKIPVPAARSKVSQGFLLNEVGKKIIEAPVVNLNPFWSDGEPSSDEELVKPVPAPRTTLKPSSESSPFSRSQYGSFTSLGSESSLSHLRRKKGPAPLPPNSTKSLQHPLNPVSNVGYRSPSPTASVRGHRKSKPAPPPPVIFRSDDNEKAVEKKEKNYENKMKQNLSGLSDKSSHGKWKRKKGQAPGLPIPQRRRITPLPLPEFYRELEDLEIQQRELERQGVTLEQTIRMYEGDSSPERGDGGFGGKDVEGLILQLFEIVNQKNELFRRQAELMYLRRQQRLEEEHADIEYQIRCLMGRPERNKTDSDKEQEEELIKRLIEVVERRNEIIECLDMDRKREVEEDKSIHHHLEAFAAGKRDVPEEGKSRSSAKSSPSLLKLIKKKKHKKEKMKDHSSKARRDADKDIDETIKDDDSSNVKTKKKWFVKP